MGKWSKVLIVTAFVIVLAAVAAAAVNVKNPRDVSFAGVPEGDAPETMPEIVFVFCSYWCDNSYPDLFAGEPINRLYYTAIIDAKGDVYYSYNRTIGEMCRFEKDGIRQLYEKYESGELLPLMLKLGDIDTEELQSSYRMLEEVRNNPEFALYESEEGAYSPLEGWNLMKYYWRIEYCHGICYDREGNRAFLLLMDKDEELGTISTDKRANELVEWVRSVIDYGSKVEKRLWAHDL